MRQVDFPLEDRQQNQPANRKSILKGPAISLTRRVLTPCTTICTNVSTGPFPTADTSGRVRFETHRLGLVAPPVRLHGTGGQLSLIRSGIHVDPRSARQVWPSDVRSSRPGESGSLVGSRRTAIPRPPRSSSWIFSSSISGPDGSEVRPKSWTGDPTKNEVGTQDA